MIRNPALRLLILFVLLVGLGACKSDGCGVKPDEMPTTAAARVDQMTSMLPATADTVVVVSDLPKMRAALQLIKDRLPNTGIVDTMQKQVQNTFGIDLLSEESWKQAGVIPDSTAVGGIYRSRLIFMMYVDNRQAFEKTLVEKSKAAFGIEAVTKSETVGKHPIKILSDDPARQIAWLYKGKLAVVSMPAIDKGGALEDGSAKLVLGEIADAKKETSLAADPGFGAFRKTLADNYPVAMFVNPRSGLNSDAAKQEIAKDPNAKAVADWAEKNVTFIGAGLGAEGDKATLKGYVGLVGDVVQKVKEAQATDVQHNWDAFATEKLLLGARLSVNVSRAYALILEAMGEEQRRAMRRDVKMFGDRFALDLEKDVFDQLAGHAGLFFYGIAGGNPMALMGIKNPADAMNALGLLFVMKFKSAEAVDKLAMKAVEASQGRLVLRPLVHLPDDASFRVLGEAQPSFGSLYMHKDMVVFASTAFGDEAMHKYLTDARDDKKLSAIEGLNLGKEFSTGDKFTGLYFNSARAQENLSMLLAMGGIGQILASIEEVSLAVDADDQGAFGLLTIDLTPAPPAAPASAPGQPPAAPADQQQ